MPTPAQKSSRLMHALVIASALLAAAGVLAFWYASEQARTAPPQTGDNAVTVTIKNKVCVPNDITVPAGRTTFTIVNQSDRTLEWEILDGVMVVEERENIAPGFSQTMTVKLQPGQFDITCGLLSNPRGTLLVTASASSEAEAARPSLVHYVGALAEYKVYLVMGSSALEDAAQQLTDAIKAGNLPTARPALTAARAAYARIEPMAARFADLDARLNAQAQYFEKREADPAYTGFYRLAHGLEGQHSTDGLLPFAEQLQSDITTLRTRLRSLDIQPAQLAGSAAALLQRSADQLVAQGADRSDALAILQGRLEGVRKIADLLSPLLTKAAPPLQQSITQHFAALDTALAPYLNGQVFEPETLSPAVRVLADDMNKINAALGLD